MSRVALFCLFAFSCLNCMGNSNQSGEQTLDNSQIQICEDMLEICLDSIVKIADDLWGSPADYELVREDNNLIISTNSLLVIFRGKTSLEKIKEIVNSFDAKISLVAENILGFRFDGVDSIAFLENAARELDDLPEIEAVSMNYGHKLENLDFESGSSADLWGFKMIKLAEAYSYIAENGIEIRPVRIAVLDGSFKIKHSELAGQFFGGYDFADLDNDVTPGDVSSSSDAYTHGTAVAGIIAAKNDGTSYNGIAFNSKIVPAKVVSSRHSDFVLDENLVLGLQYAKMAGASVVNISSGSYKSYNKVLKSQIEDLANSGIMIIASAGNSDGRRDCNARNFCPEDCLVGIDASNHFSSAYPGVISVGAIDSSGGRACFSNFSENDDEKILTLAAPGQDVLILRTDSGPTLGDGTSFAAPMATGLAGLLRSIQPDLSAVKIRQIMIDSADKVVVIYPDGSGHTWKRINVESAVKMAFEENNQSNIGFGKACQDNTECDDGLICLVNHCSNYCYADGQIVSPEISDDCEKLNCYSICPSGFVCIKVEDMSYDNPDGIRMCIKSCSADSDCDNGTYCMKKNRDNGICHWQSLKFGMPQNGYCGDLIEGFPHIGCQDNMICIDNDSANHNNTGNCKYACDFSVNRSCTEDSLCWPETFVDIYGNSGCGICHDMYNLAGINEACPYLEGCSVNAICMSEENGSFCRELCDPASSNCPNNFICYQIPNDCNDRSLGVCAP